MMGKKTAVVGTGMLNFIRLGTAADGADAAEQTPAASDVKEVVAGHDVVLFVSPGCPYCREAVSALNAKGLNPRNTIDNPGLSSCCLCPITGIAHTTVNATTEQRQELFKATGATSVPSVWVKGTYIGGCNDGPEDWMGLTPNLRSGKLEEMLA